MSSDATPRRSYDRSWEEIEEMLNRAELKRKEWKSWFEECRKNEDRDGMKEAARNHKALDGVVKLSSGHLAKKALAIPWTDYQPRWSYRTSSVSISSPFIGLPTS